MRDLIFNCVDASFIDNSFASSNGSLQKIISSFEALTAYRFQNSWNAMVEPMAALYKNVGGYSSAGTTTLLSKLTLALVELYEVGIENEDEYPVHVHRVVGVAVEYLGAEKFLSMVPLAAADKPGVLAPKREWLLSLLEEYAGSSACSLSFFGKHILSMARQHENMSRTPDMKPKDVKWHQR